MKLLRETIRRLLLESEEATIAGLLNSDDYQTIEQGLEFAETLGHISNLKKFQRTPQRVLFDFTSTPALAKEIFKIRKARPNKSSAITKPYSIIARLSGNQIRINVSKP